MNQSLTHLLALLGLLAISAPPAYAQTLAPPPALAHTAPGHHTAAHPAPAHTAATHKPVKQKTAPVVAPKHGAVPRRPVHPKVKVATPAKPAPKAAAKPAPKTSPKLAPKPTAPAKPALPPDVGPSTGLHIPRFASLKSDDINMRSGPGARYPVLWTYKRRELPVKIEREFDVWRLVEDMDGIKGWLQGATLNGRRTFVITGTDPRTLRADPSADSEAVAVLKPGVVGRIHNCDAGAAWCQVQVAGYRGWLARTDFWGTDPGELVAP